MLRGDFMKLVFITALGVGGATVIGAIIGFVFKRISHKFSDIILSFAAGVMLAAAVLGLIIPATDYGGLVVTIVGIFVGALSLNLIDKLVPHFRRLIHSDAEIQNAKLDKMADGHLFFCAKRPKNGIKNCHLAEAEGGMRKISAAESIFPLPFGAVLVYNNSCEKWKRFHFLSKKH